MEILLKINIIKYWNIKKRIAKLNWNTTKTMNNKQKQFLKVNFKKSRPKASRQQRLLLNQNKLKISFKKNKLIIKIISKSRKVRMLINLQKNNKTKINKNNEETF